MRRLDTLLPLALVLLIAGAFVVVFWNGPPRALLYEQQDAQRSLLRVESCSSTDGRRCARLKVIDVHGDVRFDGELRDVEADRLSTVLRNLTAPL